MKAGGPSIREAESALNYLEQLYPSSIGEACFIDRAGPENARYVRGVRAGLKDLSPDESGNPFFRPTFALHEGQVLQAKPYVSPASASGRPAGRCTWQPTPTRSRVSEIADSSWTTSRTPAVAPV